jgi:CrcB protein
MNRFILIALGAVLGANARYLVGLWAGERFGAGFPYGTLIVNITGSFLLGFLVATATGRLNISQEVRLLLGVGFLGAFTTFSSFAVETLTLVQNGNLWKALLNVFTNNLVGLVSALLGLYLARLVGG